MTQPPTEAEIELYRTHILGIAAIAQTAGEIGEPDDVITNTIRHHMARTGLHSRADALRIADAIRHGPQPLERSAAEEERCRPIEDMLGLTPSEDQLAGQLRAYELALAVANELPE